MTSVTEVLSSTIMECIGWTLLHSLWQFTGIAVLLWAVLGVIRSEAANVRYLVSCSGLLLGVVCCAVTFGVLLSSMDARSPVSDPGLANLALETESDPSTRVDSRGQDDAGLASSDVVTDLGAMEQSVGHANAGLASGSSSRNWVAKLTTWVSRIALVWMGGVALLSLWNLTGWIGIQRLQRCGADSLSHEIKANARALVARMNVTRPVRILQSTLVEIPIVVGWLKPAILLPASLLAELSPAQLESILAHELAHIRRNDYLVNLLQTVLETLLFYHPAVWWISGQIRTEREHCCDDMAVLACGNRIELSEALTIASAARVSTTPAVAASSSSGSALHRVRRLLDPNTERDRFPRAVAAVVVLVLLSVPLSLKWSGGFAAAQDDDGTEIDQVERPVLTSAEVSRLISQLAADDFQARQSAARSLVQAGKQVIPSVSEAVGDANPEVSRRALQVLSRLVLSADSETSTRARDALRDLQDSQVQSIADLATKELKRLTQLQEEELKRLSRARARSGQLPEKQAISALTGLGAVVRKSEGKGCTVQIGGDKWQGQDADLVYLKSLEQLTTLDLGFSDVTNAGLAHLEGLTSLRELNLPSGMTDAGLIHLRPLTNLTRLEFTNALKVDGTGLIYIADAQQLISLNLYGTSTSGEILRHITHLLRLTSLTTSQAAMTDAGMAHIAKVTGLKQLQVSHTGVTDAGFTQLSKLKNLEILDLSESPCLTDEGVVHIGRLTKLNRLTLSFNNLTDACLPSLQNLPNLRFLHLDRTFVSSSGIDELSVSIPSARISGDSCMPLASEQHLEAVRQLARLGGRVRHLTRQRNGKPAFGTEVRFEAGWTGSDEEFRYLKNLDGLEMMSIRAFIEDAAVEHLGDVDCKRVYLRNPEVGDRQLRFLREARMEMLWLEGPFSDEAIGILGDLNDLRLLVFRNTSITENGFNEIRRRLPNTTIRRHET